MRSLLFTASLSIALVCLGNPSIPPELLAQVREAGTVRVIVGLHLPAPSPSAQDSGAEERRRLIAERQDALLARMSRFAPAAVKRFETVPYIAMEVNEAGLVDLFANPEVAYVYQDKAVPPSKTTGGLR